MTKVIKICHIQLPKNVFIMPLSNKTFNNPFKLKLSSVHRGIDGDNCYKFAIKDIPTGFVLL